MARESREEVGREVRAFYQECSFPGYEDVETPSDLREKSQRGLYAMLVDEQVPVGVTVLDAGCGTGQLAIFLSLAYRHVVGIDFSYDSLRKAVDFQRKFALSNVRFAQMDLFKLGLREENFDFVFCNGVLHHTADAYGGFQNLCRLVKPGRIHYGRSLQQLRSSFAEPAEMDFPVYKKPPDMVGFFHATEVRGRREETDMVYGSI